MAKKKTIKKKSQATEQVRGPYKEPRNKTGKGGFGDNPESRNDGGRYPRGKSFTYWFEQFKMMSLAELKGWKKKNPENVRTVVSHLAFIRVWNSQRILKEFQEVANRTEGMPTQRSEVEHSGEVDVNMPESNKRANKFLNEKPSKNSTGQ